MQQQRQGLQGNIFAWMCMKSQREYAVTSRKQCRSTGPFFTTRRRCSSCMLILWAAQGFSPKENISQKYLNTLLSQQLISWEWRLHRQYFSSCPSEGRLRQGKNKPRYNSTEREQLSLWYPTKVLWQEIYSGGGTELRRYFAGLAQLLQLTQSLFCISFHGW